jgi:hypothetical protein
MTCVYDPTLQDDCTTPVAVAASSFCYDIEGNTVPCASSFAIGSTPGVPTSNSGINQINYNPVAVSASDANTNGGTALAALTALGKMGTSIFASVQTSTTKVPTPIFSGFNSTSLTSILPMLLIFGIGIFAVMQMQMQKK